MVSYMNKPINFQHKILVFLIAETFFSIGTESFKNENHSSFYANKSSNKANPQDIIELPRYLKIDDDSSGSGGSSSGGGDSSSSSSGSSSGGSSSGGSSSGGSSGSGGGGDSSSGTDGSASGVLATVTGRVGEKINGARDDLYQIYKYPDPHHWSASQWGVIFTLSVMIAAFVFGVMLLLKRSKNRHGQNEALREILIEKDDIEMHTQDEQIVSLESDQFTDESSTDYKFAESESNTPNSLNGSKLEKFSGKAKFQLSPNKSAEQNKTQDIIVNDAGSLTKIDDNEASNIPTLLNNTKLKKQISEPYKRLKRTEFKGIRGKKQLPTLVADEAAVFRRFASYDGLPIKFTKSKSNNIGRQKSNEEKKFSERTRVKQLTSNVTLHDKREWVDSLPIDRLFHITSCKNTVGSAKSILGSRSPEIVDSVSSSNKRNTKTPYQNTISKFEKNEKGPAQQHTGRCQQESGKRKKILNGVDPHWIDNISTDELFHDKSHGEILLAKVNARSQMGCSPKAHEEILPLSEESKIPSKREILLSKVNERSKMYCSPKAHEEESVTQRDQIDSISSSIKNQISSHRSEKEISTELFSKTDFETIRKLESLGYEVNRNGDTAEVEKNRNTESSRDVPFPRLQTESNQRNILEIVNDLENKGFIVQIEGDTAVVKRQRSESRKHILTCVRDISF